jgi:O-antigen ligase
VYLDDLLVRANVFLSWLLVPLWLKHPEIALAAFIGAWVMKGGQSGIWDNLTVVVLVSSAMGTLRLLMTKRKKVPRMRGADILLWMFTIWLFIGAFYTQDQAAGIIKAIRFLALVVFPYYIARIVLFDENRLQLFLFSLIVVGGIVSLQTVLSVLFDPASTIFSPRYAFARSGVIPTALLISVCLCVAIVQSAGSFNRWSRAKRVGSIGISALMVYVLLGTASRGAIGVVVVTLLVYFWVRRGRHGVTWIPVVAITGIFVLGFWSEFLKGALATYFPDIWRLDLSLIREDLFEMNRAMLREVALDMIADHHWIGIGTAGFSEYLSSFADPLLSISGYPHNIFLEVAAENGLIGLLLLCSFMGSVASVAWRNVNLERNQVKKAVDYHPLLVALSIGLLFEAQFSLSLPDHKALFILIAGIVGWQAQKAPMKAGAESTDEPRQTGGWNAQAELSYH